MKKKHNRPRRDTTQFKNIKHEIFYGKYPEKAYCVCGELATELHHKDENHMNNKRDNLIAVCRLCHMKHHYPSLYRLIPSDGAGLRKDKRIIEMTHKEILTEDDRKWLEDQRFGQAFIRAWFI